MVSAQQGDSSGGQLEKLWKYLHDEVFRASTDSDPRITLFNPYNQTHPDLDLTCGDQIRRQNLQNYLQSFQETPTNLILGEAPGWRGCRFSGVPFTSETQILSGTLPFPGMQSSRNERPYAEASATIFWRVMCPHHPQFLVWNCLPFHPYQRGKPLSNRSPKRTEIRAYLHLLEGFIEILSPTRVIAVGASAQFALAEVNVDAQRVRHPSHGGSREFQAGIEELFNPHKA